MSDKKKIVSAKVLRDLPGVEAGTIIKVASCGVLTESGSYLRGGNVGKKFYYSSEFLEYPDFFEVEFETKD